MGRLTPQTNMVAETQSPQVESPVCESQKGSVHGVAINSNVTSGAARFRQSRPARPEEQSFDLANYSVQMPGQQSPQQHVAQHGREVLARNSMGHLISNPSSSSPLYASDKYSNLFKNLEGKVSHRMGNQNQDAEALFADFLASCDADKATPTTETTETTNQ